MVSMVLMMVWMPVEPVEREVWREVIGVEGGFEEGVCSDWD